jgi:HNH endonuclease
VPSFQDWEFPHGRMPDAWAPVSSIAPIGPGHCGVTNFSLPLETAHLVPIKEQAWYNRNGMTRYGAGMLKDIDDEANILQLRSDIHAIFDARMFAIVPKTGGGTSQYVTHILRGGAANFWPRHNIFVQYLHPMSYPYLFARFAWAILLQMKTFVCVGTGRSVVQVVYDDQGEARREIQELSGIQLMQNYGGGGSTDATPSKKRCRSAAGSAQDDDSFSESLSGSDMEDMGDFWDVKWRQGTRRQRQRSSDETPPDMSPGTNPVLAVNVETDLVEAATRVIASQEIEEM